MPDARVRESWHGTTNGYNHHRCRCDDCRAAKAKQARDTGANNRSDNPIRAAQKRAHDYKPCPGCGGRMTHNSDLCAACATERDRKPRDERARRIEQWWADGLSLKEIATRLGWTVGSLSREVGWMREKGFTVPHRYRVTARSRIVASLSPAQRDLLWTIAQHKYGWAHCSNAGSGVRTLQTALALERRGLVTVDRSRHHPTCVATDHGREEIARCWPVSPFVLGTYDHQPGGWDARDAWKEHELREAALR